VLTSRKSPGVLTIYLPAMTEKPWPDSYWVVPGSFLAGGYPAARPGDDYSTRLRVGKLVEMGFNTYIDLTRPGEAIPYLPLLNEEATRYGVEISHQRHPIQDRGLPTREEMVAILDALDDSLAEGRKVYLHCLGGIGRTGTTVGCWLVRHGLSGEAALARLNELYRESEQSRFFHRAPEVDGQILFILDWKEAASSQPGSAASGQAEAGGKLNWHARYLQQATWTRELREYLFDSAGLAQARRVLEVGCGTGAILGQLNLPGAVHGLDLNPARLAEATHHAPRARLTCGDALRLPYPAGAFEITFCHYLLLWVQDPLQALREMARVTRPGGSVLALAEPDHTTRVDQPKALASLGRLQTEALRRQGANPGIGTHLAVLFQQAGIPIIETGRLGEAGDQPPSASDRRMEWAVMEADLEGSIAKDELQRLQALDEQAWEKGERVLSVPTYFAWGRVLPMV
jgi:SAM-dependent methyltransferase